MRPPLDPAVVTDDQQLATAIDRLLVADADWQRHSARVGEAQDRLRALCNDKAWRAYLDLEQVTNERLAAILVTVGRWAFEEGRQAP